MPLFFIDVAFIERTTLDREDVASRRRVDIAVIRAFLRRSRAIIAVIVADVASLRSIVDAYRGNVCSRGADGDDKHGNINKKHGIVWRMAHTMDEVAKRTGYSARAIRLLIAKGIVPRPKFRGRATEYDDDFILRLLAARKLRARRIAYQTIRTTIRKATPDALMKIAGIEPAAPKPAPATPPEKPAALTWGAIGEKWTRVALAPGLDLLLREGATPEIEALAMKLKEQVARGG